MNALYVTVSIPLLLVLVGFNHAHGLTTFGKSNNQGQQNLPAAVQAKHCTDQFNCSLIKNTTCLRGSCLCGDDTYPVNGKCTAPKRGPGHLCESDEICTQGAACLPAKQKNDSPQTNDIKPFKVCTCEEGLMEYGHLCAGGSSITLFPGVISIMTILSRTMH